MVNYIVQDRTTGEVVHAYGADQPSHIDVYPFDTFNHIPQPVVISPVVRRVSKLEFVARLGDAEFTALLGLARESVEVEKFVKMIDWATPDADGTSIDLDDPRVQAVSGLEPVLIALGKTQPGWAARVLA